MSRYEFDESDHPLRVSCYALPSFDGQTAEIDIPITEEERLRVAGVPETAIERLGMPRLSSDIPPEARGPFEKGIGLGIVACRLIDQPQEDTVVVEVPTVPEVTVVSVPLSRLARLR